MAYRTYSPNRPRSAANQAYLTHRLRGDVERTERLLASMRAEDDAESRIRAQEDYLVTLRGRLAVLEAGGA